MIGWLTLVQNSHAAKSEWKSTIDGSMVGWSNIRWQNMAGVVAEIGRHISEVPNPNSFAGSNKLGSEKPLQARSLQAVVRWDCRADYASFRPLGESAHGHMPESIWLFTLLRDLRAIASL